MKKTQLTISRTYRAKRSKSSRCGLADAVDNAKHRRVRRAIVEEHDRGRHAEYAARAVEEQQGENEDPSEYLNRSPGRSRHDKQ